MPKKLFVGVDDEWWLCRAVAVASALAHGSGLHSPASILEERLHMFASRPIWATTATTSSTAVFATAELLAGRSTTSVAPLSRDRFQNQFYNCEQV